MRLAGIHQPHYLPWLRYFEKIDACDVFILLDTVQYNKNGWQNRNRIKTRDGVQLLTVPVHAHLGDTFADVAIDHTQPWQRRHWRSVEQAYRSAPHYNWVNEALEPIYQREWTRLSDLAETFIRTLCGMLQIETPIRRASEFDVPGDGTRRLAGLVNAVGADAYYTGAHAMETYLDATAMREAGIDLRIQQWTAPQYDQLHGAFVPDLAIVDLLMNAGPDSIAILRGAGNRTHA